MPNKKVTKEVGLGETLTVKPIGTSSVLFLSYPAFKPPSPRPLPAPVVTWLRVGLKRTIPVLQGDSKGGRGEKVIPCIRLSASPFGRLEGPETI